LALVDPITGLQTTIASGNVGQNVANAVAGDDLSDSSGSAGASDTNDASVFAADNESDSGPIAISVVGSPAPGVTGSVQVNLNISGWSGSTVQGQDDSTGAGTDAGNFQFQTSDGAAASGTVTSNVTVTVALDDGHGDTTNSTEAVVDSATAGDMVSDSDGGTDNFSDANGHLVSDNEQDTERGTAALSSGHQSTDKFHETMTTVDPTTSLTTSVSATDNSTDQENDREDDTSQDGHTSSGASVSRRPWRATRT
jgi:hypothetical protein